MLGRQFVCEAQLANLRGSPEWSRSDSTRSSTAFCASMAAWSRGRWPVHRRRRQRRPTATADWTEVLSSDSSQFQLTILLPARIV